MWDAWFDPQIVYFKIEHPSIINKMTWEQNTNKVALEAHICTYHFGEKTIIPIKCIFFDFFMATEIL